MTSTSRTYRTRGNRLSGGVLSGFLLLVAARGLTDDVEDAVTLASRYGLIAVTVSLASAALFITPKLVVRAHQVEVWNPCRVWVVPFGAIQEVQPRGRYLSITTSGSTISVMGVEKAGYARVLGKRGAADDIEDVLQQERNRAGSDEAVTVRWRRPSAFEAALAALWAVILVGHAVRYGVQL